MTDEQLNKYKEYAARKPSPVTMSNEDFYALIARLEAAEAVISGLECEGWYPESLEGRLAAWRKAAGKEGT